MEPVAGLSRAELEPRLVRALTLTVPDYVTADAIWAELQARTWQHDNPYAGDPPWATP